MSTATTLPAFLTVEQFAEQLGVDKTVIYGFIRAEKVLAINVGSLKRPRFRISSKQLDAVEETLAVAKKPAARR